MGDNDASAGLYEAQLKIFVYDRIGLLADISVALSEMRVFILQINTLSAQDNRSIINLKISCKNVEHYHSIVSRLRGLRDVIDVVRGYS